MKFNYFFNSLYLLTNKTQMKMKKTQSLKLMLLGLLALGSMSVQAKVKDIFTSDMLVLEQTSNTECKVLAVADYVDGTIVIPDKVKNSFDKNMELSVSALDDNWFCGGEITLKRTTPEGVTEPAGSAVAKNLIDGGTFALKLEASKLTTLNTRQIAMVNNKITQFIVTANSGLTAIPHDAFHANTYVVDQTATQKLKDKEQAKIDAAQEHLDGLDEAAVKEGKYNGKQVYTKKNKYYVLGDPLEEADACESQLKQLLEVKADGTTAVVKNAKARVKSDGSIGYCKPTSNDPGWTWVSLGDEFEGNALYSSLEEKVAAAQKAVEDAQDAVTEAHNKTVLAEAAVLDPSYADPEVIEKAEKAQDLLDAIAAFEELDIFPSLRSKVATESGTVFEEVTPWFVAYFLANNEEFLNSLASASILKPLVEDFVEAYEAFFPGEEPTYETLMEIPVSPTVFSIVAGDVVGISAFTNPTGQGLSINNIFNAKVQPLFGFTNVVVDDADGSGNPGLIQVPDGFTPIRMIQVNGTTLPQEVMESAILFVYTNGYPVEGKYYTVYRYSPDEASVLYEEFGDEFAEVGMVPATNVDWLDDTIYDLDSYMLVQIDPNTETFTLQREVPTVVDITAAYPGLPIKEALDAANTTQDDLEEAAEQARQDEAQAKKDLAQAKKDLTAAKNALKAGNQALKDAEDGLANVKDVYHFVFGGDNKTLVYVEWTNEKIAEFGESCFEDCTNPNLKFVNGTATEQTPLPAVTTTIGAKAFENTTIDAGFLACNANINTIGDKAFYNTKTQYINLKDATKLTDTGIGNDVFDLCPVKMINLENTQMTYMPEGLAEDILRGEQAKDCDENPIEGAFINSTLTTVVMPKNSTLIRAKNFWFCENLSSITIPAGVTFIGEYALAGTALTGLDLTHLTKLEYVGDAAFAYNKLMTSVKFAPTSPFESLEGDIFRCDNSLTTIELNDSVKCIEEGLFADTKIQKLDLSKTQITVLPDLFWGDEEKAADANSVCNTLTEILLPERKMDALNDEVLRPGLEVIGNHAFAFLQGITEMTIPSTVWAMGTWAFAYCSNLTTVTAMDSQLRNLGSGTFRNCTNLENFTFVTLSVIDPKFQTIGSSTSTWADPCGNAVRVGGTFDFDDTQFYLCTKKPVITVTEESYDILKGQYYKAYAQEYSELAIFQPTLTLKKKGLDLDGNDQYSDGYYNVNYGTWIPVTEASVFTAYQDRNKVLLFKAKHNNGYYKIPALNPNGESFGGDYDDIPYWLTKGAIQQNIWQYNAKDLPITEIAQGSPAVIIISSKDKINVERHSRPGEKYQSTLDRDNELKIAANPLKTDMTSIICAWGKQEGVVTFWRFNNGMTLPKGQVVLPLSAWQGTANGRIEVVFVDDEVTSIKDYIKALNDSSDAIYNLQGIRVSNPQKGQLYIQGGKKFIQK
jgi:hypothetical protein